MILNRGVSGWIGTAIAVVALGFSLWTWHRQRQDSAKHDKEERVARVNAALVNLSAVAHRAAAGSPHDHNTFRAAQADLGTAIAAAHVEFPSCQEAADAPGVLAMQGHEEAAFREVREYSTDLARGKERDW